VGNREQSLSYDCAPFSIIGLFSLLMQRISSFSHFFVNVQRSRFKAVESLQTGSRAVVVATDVAARGLDIPNVATVVHYDVARKVDGFVHRAGRTAVRLRVFVHLRCRKSTMKIKGFRTRVSKIGVVAYCAENISLGCQSRYLQRNYYFLPEMMTAHSPILFCLYLATLIFIPSARNG